MSGDVTALLNNITDSTTNDTVEATTSLTSTLHTVTTTPLTTTTTLSPVTTTTLPPTEDSHFLFAFCTVLFFVGIAVIVKIIYSNTRRYRNLTPSIPTWRLSASRSSGNGSFPQFDRDSLAPRHSRFVSAHYAAVPPSTNARLASQQRDAFVADTNAQQEWERQFFEDDGIGVDFAPTSLR